MFDFFFSCGKRRENQKEIEEMSLTEKKHGGVAKDENKDEVGEEELWGEGRWGDRSSFTVLRYIDLCLFMILHYSQD